ncbi:MAG: Do family serine endopeptidase [Bacteroidales bacterium]
MFNKILFTFLIGFMGGLFAIGAGKHIEKTQRIKMGIQPEETHFFKANYSISDGNYPDFTKAAEMSVHAVVHVKTQFSQNHNYYNPFPEGDPFHDFFNDRNINPSPKPEMGSGSGVIISDDGYIVTNNHVVNNADQIEVTLNNKKTFKAQIIGTDPITDLALLKIDAVGLSYLRFGNSDSLKVGEWVLAVGNPFNLTSTVTAGIVSAKGRNIGVMGDGPVIESYIQTDAAINPGNSGGALVNTKGELVGINAAIASNTGSYTGYSFAIPVSIVRKVMDDLLKYGAVKRALLGINIKNIDSGLADEKGLKETDGVYVDGVSNNSAADLAGIRKGDVILKINDIKISNTSELQEQVSKFRPGDRINVTIKRDSEERVISVVLKNENGDTEIVKKENSEIISMLGATFEPVTKEEKKRLGIESGVKIKKIDGGKLRNAGIREGFIITLIDKKPINNKEDLKQSFENKKGGILIEGVYPNGTRAYYGFGL